MQYAMWMSAMTAMLGSFLIYLPQLSNRYESTPNRAALIVSFEQGVDYGVCISFEEEEISGYELLSRSALAIESEPSGAFGEAVCRIDVTGCDIPEQKCFCECQGPKCFYWSYWRLQGDAWTYSQQGASLTNVRDGSVEGWVWGRGTINQDAERVPPSVSFEEVCLLRATTTPRVVSTTAATNVAANSSAHTIAPDLHSREIAYQ